MRPGRRARRGADHPPAPAITIVNATKPKPAKRLAGPDALDPVHVVRGQLYLGELLLLYLVNASGVDPENARAWAGEWLRSFSPQLPG